MWNRSKGYTSFKECHIKAYLIATAIGIICFLLEQASVAMALFGAPFLIFMLGWPIVLISFIITRIILASKK